MKISKLILFTLSTMALLFGLNTFARTMIQLSPGQQIDVRGNAVVFCAGNTAGRPQFSSADSETDKFGQVLQVNAPVQDQNQAVAPVQQVAAQSEEAYVQCSCLRRGAFRSTIDYGKVSGRGFTRQAAEDSARRSCTLRAYGGERPSEDRSWLVQCE